MYCEQCGTEITENREVCPNCGTTLKNKKSPTTAVVLSMVWTGLGQLYNGQIVKGICLWIVCLIGWMISPIFGIIVWACGVWDAYDVANGTRKGTTEEKKNTSIGVTFVKGFFYSVVALLGLICIGAFVFGMGSGVSGDATSTSDVTPTVEVTPEESDVEEGIIVYKDGQNEIVECKRLSVFGNNNAIQIANKDVEKILITGHGNVISYSCDADPKIIDHGNYNDVWQRWLT